MPAFVVTTNPTKLDPLKPGGKATVVVTATNQLPRAVTARAQKVVDPPTFDALVKPPPSPQRTFSQKGATQDFPFSIEIPADAKAGSFTTRFDVVDVANPDDNFGQSSGLKVTIEVPPPPVVEKKKIPWWVWVAIGVGVLILGIVIWIATHQGPKMPKVVGMNIEDAKTTLAKDSIRVVQRDTLNSDTVSFKGGEVIEQNPKAGSKLKSKPDTNSVTLSVQVPFAVVPALRGQVSDSSILKLGLAGFRNIQGFSTCNTDARFSGKVFSVTPSEGTLQSKSTVVKFWTGVFQPTPCPRIRIDTPIRILQAIPAGPALTPRIHQ